MAFAKIRLSPNLRKLGERRSQANMMANRAMRGGSDVEDIPTADPLTVMSSGNIPSDTTVSGKKQKKKTRKRSAKEKQKDKLDKEATNLRESGPMFDSFMRKADNWVKENFARALVLFKKIDLDSEGTLSTEDFKSAMFDLNSPFNAVELHLLAVLFDLDRKEEVCYLDLKTGLEVVREKEATYRKCDVRPALPMGMSVKDYHKCTTCNMAAWDGETYVEKYPRYIKIHFRHITFQGMQTHPGHFSHVIHSHCSIHGLLQLIKDVTAMQTTRLALFTELNRSPESQLEESKTLEEYGFQDGPRDSPPDLTLYYDYRVEFTDCPLLMADHYFGQKS